MADFERRHGQGHRLWQPAAQPPIVDNAAPANNAAPRQQPLPRPPQDAAQGDDGPAQDLRARDDYHEIIARSTDADLEELAWRPSRNCDPGEPRLSYDEEVLPDDTAVPYDELVRRGQAEPRAAPVEQARNAGPRAVPALAQQPARNNAISRAPPRAGPAVNMIAPQQQVQRHYATVNTAYGAAQNYAVGMATDPFPLANYPFPSANYSCGMSNNPFSMNNNFFRMPADLVNARTTIPAGRPQGPDYPKSEPGDKIAGTWLDDDAEAKDLFKEATAALEKKRDEMGLDQKWVEDRQFTFHKTAYQHGIAAAKALMRDTQQKLELWEKRLKTMQPMYFGGMGGMGGGMGGGFGMGFGGMGHGGGFPGRGF